MKTSSAQGRLVFVSLGIFFLFSLLIIQFFKIQILEGEKWNAKAKRQHEIVVTEPFQRGVFYANMSLKKGHPQNEQPFVIDIPKFHLFADPEALPPSKKEEVAKVIAEVLHLSLEERQKLASSLHKKTRSRRLVLALSKESKDKIEVWWKKFAKTNKIERNALFFIKDYKRSYPFGKLLGSLLHTVREERDIKTRQQIPTGGLELFFDRVLQGKEGKRRLLRSPRHTLEVGEILRHPENGADVYLTIDPYLQAIAEEEIEKAVKKAEAKGGWAILMDPHSGEILALAQYPFFFPANYRTYFNDKTLLDCTKVKAITDAYEPGSTMKPITVAIALLANEELIKRGKPPLFSPMEKIPTAQGVFPGRSRPISDVHTYRYLNMYTALQKSSNIYMARLVQRIIDRLGEKWYRDVLHDVFKFGQKTGLELPSESPGLLPRPGNAQEWSVPTPFSMAFGHNILVNSIQMLQSYAILANGGSFVKPTLIRKIAKKGKEGKEEILLDRTDPSYARKKIQVLDPKISREVVKALKYVTKPGGSASKADIPGYTEAGKTATSEKIVGGTYSKTLHISTFIGFAPAENPQFVLYVGIDEPVAKYIPGVGKNQYGGNCAAPAFKEIGLRSLEYLGVERDDPYGYPIGDPRRVEEKADWIKEIKALKALHEEWNR